MKLSKIVYIAAFKRYEPFKSPSNWQCLYVVYHLPVRMRNNALHWTQDTTTNCKGNIKVERLLNHLLERRNQYGTSTKGIKNSCQRCELDVRYWCGWGKGRGSRHHHQSCIGEDDYWVTHGLFTMMPRASYLLNLAI